MMDPKDIPTLGRERFLALKAQAQAKLKALAEAETKKLAEDELPEATDPEQKP